jgi:hypothetical protein
MVQVLALLFQAVHLPAHLKPQNFAMAESVT